MSDDAQKRYWLDPRHLDYHRRQFANPYRSTIALGQFIERVMGRPPTGKLLDVACGAGANIHYLSGEFPEARWIGTDLSEDLCELGDKLNKEAGARPIEFVPGDFFKLTETFPAREFDGLLFIHTLLALSSYEKHLEMFLRLIKPGSWIFISSLFSDSTLDAFINLREYDPTKPDNEPTPILYNVYCLPRFTDTCKRLGASEVRVEEFAIDVDLPRPEHKHMGTYTEQLADGRRLQLSGPLWMQWKFVAVRRAP